MRRDLPGIPPGIPNHQLHHRDSHRFLGQRTRFARFSGNDVQVRAGGGRQRQVKSRIERRATSSGHQLRFEATRGLWDTHRLLCVGEARLLAEDVKQSTAALPATVLAPRIARGSSRAGADDRAGPWRDRRHLPAGASQAPSLCIDIQACHVRWYLTVDETARASNESSTGMSLQHNCARCSLSQMKSCVRWSASIRATRELSSKWSPPPPGRWSNSDQPQFIRLRRN